MKRDVKKGMRDLMIAWSSLTALVPADRITIARPAKLRELPAISLARVSGVTDRLDVLHDEVYQIDIWGRTVTECEDIFAEIRDAFNATPLAVPGARLGHCEMGNFGESDEDEPLQVRHMFVQLRVLTLPA